MVVVKLSSKLILERCDKENSNYIGMKCVERVAVTSSWLKAKIGVSLVTRPCFSFT